MSITFEVYFYSTEVPSILDWERAASDLGVQLNLNPEETPSRRVTSLHDLDAMTPIRFQGSLSGFEFDLYEDPWNSDELDAPSDDNREPRKFEELIRQRDMLVIFSCFARERAATEWAALAFAKACKGLFVGETGEIHPDLDQAVAEARA